MQATIHIHNQYLKFSAAHYTIFSATERERLHGHNFAVSAEATAPVGVDGLTFDYNILKDKLRTLCDQLDEYTLIAARSPYQTIQKDKDHIRVEFAGVTVSFLRSDTLLLPVRNITAEEMSRYLLDQLLSDPIVAELGITELCVGVSSGPGQTGTSRKQLT